MLDFDDSRLENADVLDAAAPLQSLVPARWPVAALLLAVPSFTTKETVRVAVLGLSEVLR